MSSTTEPIRDVFDADGRGLQHQCLRRANERAVLNVIGFNPGVSNADISRLSGLAPQTVSAILGDMERTGLIMRGDVLRGRRGQPATPIYLAAEGAFSIGVAIGWRHVDVLLLNLRAEVLVHQHRGYEYPDARTILADIAAIIDTITASMSDGARTRLVDLGVALPTNPAGNMDLEDAPDEQRNLWSKLDVVAELGRRTGLEVSLFNDGNAACWSELIAFPRPRPASFIYFLISRYLAAGIVGEGTLWKGPSGNSANLGSMLVLDADGQLRSAHFIASTLALAQRLEAAGHNIDPVAVETWAWDSFGSVLDHWIKDAGRALAMVVFNTTTVIESGLVMIDGIIPSAIVERLVAQVVAEFEKLPVTATTRPQVTAGHIGAVAPAMGAAELTLYRRFLSRTRPDIVA